MKRVALLVQYDGSNYSGWQRQNNASTVQEILEKALLRGLTTQLIREGRVTTTKDRAKALKNEAERMI